MKKRTKRRIRYSFKFIGFAFVTAIFIAQAYWIVRLAYWNGFQDGVQMILSTPEAQPQVDTSRL